MSGNSAGTPAGPRELRLISRSYRGGCAAALLALVLLFTALVVLFVVDGKGRDPGGVVFLACAALAFLSLAVLTCRGSKTTLDGTILSYENPLRRRRSCDLAQVDSARVSFGTSETAGAPVPAMRTCDLILDGGGDLRALSLRPGFRWARAEDLMSLAMALETNDNAAVAPAIATLKEMAHNQGRPPA